MLLLTAAFGALDNIYATEPGWEMMSLLLDSLSSAFCLSMWCGCDARLHGFRLGRGMRWSIILFAIIAFPVYAFSYRGRCGWILLGLSALFFMLLTAVYEGAGYAADFIIEKPE